MLRYIVILQCGFHLCYKVLILNMYSAPPSEYFLIFQNLNISLEYSSNGVH